MDAAAVPESDTLGLLIAQLDRCPPPLPAAAAVGR